MEKEEIEIFKIFRDTRKNSNSGALWEVSNYGRVRKNGKEYIPSENGSGYLVFGNYFVHRAVAELFLENTEQKPTVDHKNRQKFDNRASNLQWATYQEQMANRDKDVVSKSISKSLIGNKNFLGHKHTEESKAKMSAARLGRSHSEETKAKMRAAALGHKNVLGRVWVFNPTTEQSNIIDPSELTDYLDKGYIKGRKAKK